jgi:prepilin-type processing-associated H-X9-DG protein
MQMPSYFTASAFLLYPNVRLSSGKWNSSTGVLEIYSQWDATPTGGNFQLPVGFGPKLTKVGNPSLKVYVSDGGLYGTLSNTTLAFEPNIVLGVHGAVWSGSTGGQSAYSDLGDGYALSAALCRFETASSRGSQAGVPQTPPAPVKSTDSWDPRLFGFRHGSLKPWFADDSYRFNAAFFDGHVETLGAFEGADPHMWFPPGTEIAAYEIGQDARDKYMQHDQFIGPTNTGTSTGYFILNQ